MPIDFPNSPTNGQEFTSGTFSANEPCLLRINNGFLEASAEAL